MPVLFLSTTNKTDNNRWEISALRAVMFHHKLDAIRGKFFFFEAVLFSLVLHLWKLFVKLCHCCNFAAKISVAFNVFHLKNILNTLWLTQQWKRTQLLTILQKSLTEIIDWNCHTVFTLYQCPKVTKWPLSFVKTVNSSLVNVQIIMSMWWKSKKISQPFYARKCSDDIIVVVTP